MKIKTSLHIHTAEDKREGKKIKYTVYQLIDQACQLDFKVLALTGHEYFVYKPEYGDYARDKGILLIPGIELTLNKHGLVQKHVVVLNCQPEIENIKTLEELVNYKESHPEIFVLAPHPHFFFNVSLGLKTLKKYINLFDAIEYSWFYTKKINLNKKSEIVAKEHHKPIISTSDLHRLKWLNQDYALIDTPSLDIISVLKAIKQQKFTNITQPKKLIELIVYIIKTTIPGINKKVA